MQFTDPSLPTENWDESKPKNDSEELAKKYAIPVVPMCRYVKEKHSGHVHLFDPRFAERGDLLEPYTPTLKERIAYGEDLGVLSANGITAEQLLAAGATEDKLVECGVELLPHEELSVQKSEVKPEVVEPPQVDNSADDAVGSTPPPPPPQVDELGSV